MNILVLNKNIVVSKLISLSVKEFNVNITEVESLSQIIKKDEYDIIFIDDSSYDNRTIDLINETISPIKIILYSDETYNQQELNYDFKIKKPFLPVTIIELLNDIIKKDTNDLSDSNDLSILLDYDDTKSEEPVEKSNKNQGDSIKNLLIDDSLDDIDNDIFEDKDSSMNNINGNDLLELLLDTKVDALREVFAGAKINITIEFPKDKKI